MHQSRSFVASAGSYLASAGFYLASARVLLAGAAVGFAIPASVLANDWDVNAGDCVRAFGAPDKADERKLLACADLFSSEARLQLLSAADKAAAEKGLRWLYENGSDLAAKVARDGLFRLDIKLPPRDKREGGKPAAAAATAAVAERKRYDPPEAKEADRKAADALAKDAVGLLKKKKWAAGAGALEKALAKDPRSEFVLYNLACAEANVTAKQPKAVPHLQDMGDLGTDVALDRLVKARADSDFEAIRETGDFKRVTGYMRVQIVNTMGPAGETAVENIEKLLIGLGHRKPDQVEGDPALQAPIIQSKANTRAQTALVAELLGNPNARLDPLPESHKYDMVIRWGGKLDEKGKPVDNGPASVDDALVSARKRQNKVLARPESAINNVNKVIDTPGRVISDGEGMKSRVEGTANKAAGVYDKVKDADKILDKAKGLGDVKIKGL